jgi:hypothetical protein
LTTIGAARHLTLDLTILLEPANSSEPPITPYHYDAVTADYGDARAGPITGVLPRDYPLT